MVMDPTQALSDALHAIRIGDREAAIDATEDLLTWLRKDGAMPDLADTRVTSKLVVPPAAGAA